MVPLDLTKEQALDTALKAIQRMSFTAKLDRAGRTTSYFIL